jgi:hypothetical protein
MNVFRQQKHQKGNWRPGGVLTLGIWIATRSLPGEIAVTRIAKELLYVGTLYQQGGRFTRSVLGQLMKTLPRHKRLG